LLVEAGCHSKTSTEGLRCDFPGQGNTDALPGDPDHLQVFATDDVANRWFEQHDPEGVASEYPVSKMNWINWWKFAKLLRFEGRQ
jgi:hypothetical protein